VRQRVGQERREDIVCAAASSTQQQAGRVSCSQLPYPVSFTQDAFGGTNMLRLPSLHSRSFILSPLSYLTAEAKSVSHCEASEAAARSGVVILIDQWRSYDVHDSGRSLFIGRLG
jgi:hypothetical protein